MQMAVALKDDLQTEVTQDVAFDRRAVLDA